MAVAAREIDHDATLVLAVQGGDRAAFTELFRRHYPSVKRACARRLLDVAEAEEIAQATFVRALERIDQCAGERNFSAWVHVIARRQCIDALRGRNRVTPQEQPIKADRPTPVDGPEESLLGRERSLHLARALSALPDRQRQVVIDRDVHEHRPGEIAAGLGISIGAVDSLLLRARRRLAAVYQNVAGDQGLATAHTTSAAAATLMGGAAAVAEPGKVASAVGSVARVVAAATDAVQSLAFQAAQLAGVVPGASGHPFAAAVATAALLAGSPAPPPAHSGSSTAPVVQAPPSAPSSPTISTTTPSATPLSPPSPNAPSTPAPPSSPPAVSVPDPTAGGQAPPTPATPDPGDVGAKLLPSAGGGNGGGTPGSGAPPGPAAPAVGAPSTPDPTQGVPSAPPPSVGTIPSAPSTGTVPGLPSVTLPTVTLPSVPAAPAAPSAPTGTTGTVSTPSTH